MYNSAMPSAADIIRRRRQRRNQKSQSSLQKSRSGTVTALSVLSLFIALAAIGIAVVYSDLTRALPALETLPQMMDPDTGLIRSPSVILDRTGRFQIASLGSEGGPGNYLSIEEGLLGQVSPFLIDAIIAEADPGYWGHPGFYRETLLSGERDTIPLKLVSALLFWDEPEGWRRYLREGILAAQIVSNFGRQQVLEWYLNSVHFGRNTFGADAAARLYFGKSAGLLTMAEAATLAAVSQAPDLNPVDTPELALDRRDKTLDSMYALGLITESEVVAARTKPLGVRPVPDNPLDDHAALVNLVVAQVGKRIPEDVLNRGGLTIISTINVELQSELACTISTQLQRLVEGDASLPEDCKAARLLPSLAGDNLPAEGTSAEGVVLDPKTGQILAFAVNDAAAGPGDAGGLHQPGSILTPYVYLTSFARGLGPATLTWDIPAYLPPGVSSSPNLDKAFHGPMRIRTALAGDYLVPALHLLSQFGPSNIWNTAALSGLPGLSGEVETLLLEGGALHLIEIAHAYSAFSAQGVMFGYADDTSPLDPAPLLPTAVIRVEDLWGRAWIDNGPPLARPVMSAPLAYAMTNVLSDETARWPALGHPNILEVGRPAGVKMGFSQDQSSVWTVGFTPQITLGIWVGNEQFAGQPTEAAEVKIDPRAAAGIWHAVLKYATKDMPQEGWPVPQGVLSFDVCDPSGLRPTVDCPVVVREIFLQGNEPVQLDTLYRKFEVNRETGLLATVFTPASLIEQRVFFVPPPEALSWAQTAGLNIPPENYDLVSQPPAPDPDAQISTPGMFSYVSGVIDIRGSANGSGFQSFRVQVGKGLNPQQWLQLGDVSVDPVTNDSLAEWDTQGLNGLYAVRLLVVRENNLVDTHIIQLTVDNQAPELSILYPVDGQQFSYPQNSTVTMQLSVSDNLLLRQVDVYLNDRLMNSLTQPPYALSLDLLPGEHVLRAEAVDEAGNKSVVEQKLIVER